MLFTGPATRSSEKLSENLSVSAVLVVPSAGSVHAVTSGAMMSAASISSRYTDISPLLAGVADTLAKYTPSPPAPIVWLRLVVPLATTVPAALNNCSVGTSGLVDGFVSVSAIVVPTP